MKTAIESAEDFETIKNRSLPHFKAFKNVQLFIICVFFLEEVLLTLYALLTRR